MSGNRVGHEMFEDLCAQLWWQCEEAGPLLGVEGGCDRSMALIDLELHSLRQEPQYGNVLKDGRHRHGAVLRM